MSGETSLSADREDESPRHEDALTQSDRFLRGQLDPDEERLFLERHELNGGIRELLEFTTRTEAALLGVTLDLEGNIVDENESSQQD